MQASKETELSKAKKIQLLWKEVDILSKEYTQAMRGGNAKFVEDILIKKGEVLEEIERLLGL
jgi:hypothetical protein